MQNSISASDIKSKAANIPSGNLISHSKPNLKINKDDLLNRIASTSKVIENILSKLQPNSNNENKSRKKLVVKNYSCFPSDFFAGNGGSKGFKKLNTKRNHSISSHPNQQLNPELEAHIKKNVLKFMNGRANSTPKFNNDVKAITPEAKESHPVKFKLVYSRSQNSSPKRLVIPRTNDNLSNQAQITNLKSGNNFSELGNKIVTRIPLNVVRVASDGVPLENYQTFAKQDAPNFGAITPEKVRPETLMLQKIPSSNDIKSESKYFPSLSPIQARINGISSTPSSPFTSQILTEQKPGTSIYTFPEKLDLRKLEPTFKKHHRHSNSACMPKTEATMPSARGRDSYLPLVFGMDQSPFPSPGRPTDSNFPSPVHRRTESQPISPEKMFMPGRQSIGNTVFLPRLFDPTPVKVTPRTKLEMRHPSIRRIRTVNVRALDKNAFKVIHTQGEVHEDDLKEGDSQVKPYNIVVESNLKSEPTIFFNPKFTAHKKNKLSADFSFNKEPSECNDVSTQDKSSPDKVFGSYPNEMNEQTPVQGKENFNFYNPASILNLQSADKKIRSKRKILVNTKIQHKFF